MESREEYENNIKKATYRYIPGVLGIICDAKDQGVVAPADELEKKLTGWRRSQCTDIQLILALEKFLCRLVEEDIHLSSIESNHIGGIIQALQMNIEDRES